jgi:hypothetical protein
VKDVEARLASDLSPTVIRLGRQLPFRQPDSPVSLSQLSALSTLAKEGPMTSGVLASKTLAADLMSGIVDESA